MNHYTIILAHGSLGSWDEVVFLSIAAIFLIMMGVSWVRSRMSIPEEVDEPAEDSSTPPTDETPERFRLD